MSKLKEWFYNIFGEDSDVEYEFLDEDDFTGAYLMQSVEPNDKKLYTYKVYDNYDTVVKSWKSAIDSRNLPLSQFHNSINYHLFLKVVDKLQKDLDREYGGSSVTGNTPKQISWFEDDYLYDSEIDSQSKPISYSGYSGYSGWNWEPPKKSTGFLDKLNKSDTLVIHCSDRSTDMLSQIYEGKGWDVLRDGDIDKEELHKLLESHDRIVMLGHGSPSGLFNIQGGGYVIGSSEAPFLKGKKLFAVWCYAHKFFEKYGIGKGQFITKNTPSEKWESEAAGCGNISAELMLENITYWSKLCADIVEQCLNGNVQSGVDYLRKNYLEQYGNHPVTIFNADSAHALGTDVPLPKYEFKGKPLEKKDYPYPNFNEEQFLKAPFANIRTRR